MMTSAMTTHYQTSGRIPLVGTLAVLGWGSLAAAFLGVIYTLAVHYLHFIVIMLALPWALGFALLQVVGPLTKIYKLRNRLVIHLVAAVVAMVALYMAWGTTIYGMIPHEELPQALRALTWRPYLPQSIWEFGQRLYATGYFVLRDGDPPIRGWILGTAWVLEAAIVIGLPTFFANVFTDREVFCERCDQWVRGETVQWLLAYGGEPQWPLVQQGDWEALNTLPRGEPGMRPLTYLTVHACPGCEELTYLTVTAERVKADGRGEEFTLVDRLQIPREGVEQIRTCGFALPEQPEEEFEEETPEDDDSQ